MAIGVNFSMFDWDTYDVRAVARFIREQHCVVRGGKQGYHFVATPLDVTDLDLFVAKSNALNDLWRAMLSNDDVSTRLTP